MSRCAVPSVLSAQSTAYHSLPRVNKPLDNAWILQEAMQDQSSSKVMGWDCGAVRPAGMHLPYQTQLGHVGIECAPVKAGTLGMQVESACVGTVTLLCRARSQRSPRITLGAGRTGGTPAFAPRGGDRRCPAEERRGAGASRGERGLASEQSHLWPHCLSPAFPGSLPPLSSCQPPAR